LSGRDQLIQPRGRRADHRLLESGHGLATSLRDLRQRLTRAHLAEELRVAETEILRCCAERSSRAHPTWMTEEAARPAAGTAEVATRSEEQAVAATKERQLATLLDPLLDLVRLGLCQNSCLDGSVQAV